MSDDFNPYQPQAADQGNTLLPGQRPATATVFGILNLVFGILGVCSNIAGIAGFAVMASNIIDEKTKAQMNMQQFDDPVFFGLLCAQFVFNAILSVIAIIAGIGLLKFKLWGRKLSNFYAVAYLILLTVGVASNVIFAVIPAINDANDPAATPEKVGAAIGGAAGGVFSVCFGIIYPICIFVFLNRRKFVEQLKAAN